MLWHRFVFVESCDTVPGPRLRNRPWSPLAEPTDLTVPFLFPIVAGQYDQYGDRSNARLD